MQYTVDEHFVSRFIINRFSNSQEQVGFINIKKNEPVIRTSKSTAICFCKDMYEIKNTDGTYFERNSTENRYAAIEAEISGKLEPMIAKLHLGGRLSAEDNAYLAVLLALQLVRVPMMKRVIYKKEQYEQNAVRQLEQNSTYKMMIDSVDSGILYLRQNGFNLSEETIQQIRNTTKHKQSLLEEVICYIEEKCAFYIVTTNRNHFVLSDRPVLIDTYDNTKYIFPIDLKHAIICAVCEIDQNIDWGYLNMIEDTTVDEINQFSYENSENLVMFHPDDSSYALSICRKK